jgi:hypothetical protein
MPASSSLVNAGHQHGNEKARKHRANSRFGNKQIESQADIQKPGGEGGIRTPDTVTRMPHFECGAFNRSATSPEPEEGLKKP